MSATLRSLRIRTDFLQWHEEQINEVGALGSLFTSRIAFPQLRELVLDTQEGFCSDVEAFLRRHPLLKEVRLMGLSGGKMEWRGLLRYMREFETVDRIHLDGTMDAEDWEVRDGSDIEYSRVFLPEEREIAVQNDALDHLSHLSRTSLWDYIHGVGVWDRNLTRLFGRFG